MECLDGKDPPHTGRISRQANTTAHLGGGPRHDCEREIHEKRRERSEVGVAVDVARLCELVAGGVGLVCLEMRDPPYTTRISRRVYGAPV